MVKEDGNWKAKESISVFEYYKEKFGVDGSFYPKQNSIIPFQEEMGEFADDKKNE